MKKRLFIILFFTGILPLIPAIPRRYYLIQQSRTWGDAQAYCQATYTDLAIVDSDANMVQFQKESQKQQFSSTAWIGLYNDFNYWHWSFNDTPLGSLRPWAFSFREPDNMGGKQECGVICQYGWGDSPCQNPMPFLCFDAGRTGTGRFTYYATLKTWLDAQAYCRQHHTDLATVTNTTENTVVLGMLSQWTFFGLYRFPWRWVDKTKLSTFVWASGQPDNYARNENCAYLNNGQLSDSPCSIVLPFFCYSVKYPDVIIKQTIKVILQSSEDVNDPAVMAAILDKIQQKYKDKQLGNVTVKFREEQDGKVFKIKYGLLKNSLFGV